MKIQIVVPCINLWEEYTKECLNSVFKAAETAKLIGEIDDYRILLIDNGSTDGTKEEASKLVSQHFSHKRNEERWGFQESVNYGVNDAWERDMNYCMVLNNDTILNPYAIAELVDYANNPDDPSTGMITAMDVTSECPVPIAIYDKAPVEKEDVPVSEHPNFSAFLIKRSAWEKVGEFDTLFYPAYFEDNDYHYRMQLAGKPAVTYPRAMFYHYGSRTQREALKEGPVVSHAAFENARANYFKKWGGPPGQEMNKTPYGDPNLTLKSTKQDEAAGD